MQRQATLKKQDKQILMKSRRIREGLFIAGMACSLYFLLSLLTYHSADPGWSHTAAVTHIANSGGRVGAWISDIILYLFGYMAYLLPLMMIYIAWVTLQDQASSVFEQEAMATRIIGFILTFAAGCGLINTQFLTVSAHLPYESGGILGYVVSLALITAFNVSGATLILYACFLTGITFATGLSWLWVSECIGRRVCQWCSLIPWPAMPGLPRFKRAVTTEPPVKKQRKIPTVTTRPSVDEILGDKPEPVIARAKPVIKSEPVITKPSQRYEQDKQAPLFDVPTGSLPSLTLLDAPKKSKNKGYSNERLESMSREVEQRLSDFGIDVQVVAVNPGPVITRFEMQLAPGIKVSRITGLSKDLARSLSVPSVRIVEVIAGKSVVGLELPNEHREVVGLSEVLLSEQYEQARSPLSLALGNDIAGHPVIVDLAKMPHLLVAGTTGSGKSVGLNAMLLSLLFKATPAEVRLILIDPKMLELSVYDDIPHLLTPVVTDMKDASQALRWCVVEMERRYRLMSALGVRNLRGFNVKITEAEKAGKPIQDPLWQTPGEPAPFLESLPFIVVVIDELADMMMVVGKKVEQLIARIAQKARAAGIHMILATQRPSVDVLTGLIKSNIPTRISFQVSSKIDSRTILDQQGADQLLGHGDMLYLAPGNATPVRVHGAFVDDHEVHKVTADWKRRGKPDYIDTILEGADSQAMQSGITILPGEGNLEEADPLYDQAVFFVTETRKASISSVQRKFKIGYNRAARLIEEMERQESSAKWKPMAHEMY